MTTAVCLKCGTMKIGAFCACGSCGWTPLHEDDLIVSVAMTDHFLTPEKLQEMSDCVRMGERMMVSPENHKIISEMLHRSGILDKLRDHQAKTAFQPFVYYQSTSPEIDAILPHFQPKNEVEQETSEEDAGE